MSDRTKVKIVADAVKSGFDAAGDMSDTPVLFIVNDENDSHVLSNIANSATMAKTLFNLLNAMEGTGIDPDETFSMLGEAMMRKRLGDEIVDEMMAFARNLKKEIADEREDEGERIWH